MWIVFKKKELSVAGLTPHTEVGLTKKAAIKEIVDGLLDPGKLSDYDAIEFNDEEKALEILHAFPGKLFLKGDAKNPKVTIREPESFSLRIHIDAPDKHPVDGIHEIPADGKSSARITVRKVDERLKVQKSTRDNDEIFLRTNFGTLRDADGKGISSIKLKEGRGTFYICSEKVRRVATIELLSKDSKLQDTMVRVEFI